MLFKISFEAKQEKLLLLDLQEAENYFGKMLVGLYKAHQKELFIIMIKCNEIDLTELRQQLGL
jgi:hypothetical protein